MVFFTCNICGESVKKPSVEKHYNTKCRSVPISVSCMDCQKDFKGNEYVEHTSCITEAEKYSGKDYVPKPSHNAGLKKQQCWLEVVRSILSATDLQMSPDIRRTLQRLQTYDNVPRKKDKFINFIVNCLRIKRQQAEPVWKVVEVALEKYKEVRFGPKKPDEQKAKDANGNVGKEKMKGHSEEAANVTVDKKKDKKKKKDKHESTKIEQPTLEETIEEVPKKKKKKDKKQDQSITENGSMEEVVVEEVDESSKKKKKRSKGIENEVPNGIEAVENGGEASEDAPPKKKKKKSSGSEELTNGTLPATSDKTSLSTPGRFDWINELYSIVEKNGEIEVEKLKSKVLKKFKKFNQIDELRPKIDKTFNKKLRKSGLLVVNNVVKTRN